jgi:integrase
MKGSVLYQKSAKRYYIQVYWNGERVRVWKHPVSQEPFFDKRSAEKQLSRIQTEIDDGEFHPKHWLPESPMLLSVYAQTWLETKDVTKKTLKNYKASINLHIVPFFKDKDIRRIHANDLKLFKKHIGTILQPKGVYNAISVLRTLYHDAYANEDIARIPPFPKLSIPETIPEYIELDQQNILLSAIPERHRPIFMFGMEYGLRVGEVRAIMKDAIADGKLTIRRSLSEYELKETKTETWRQYELTQYAKLALSLVEPHLSQFVFVREDGQPYSQRNLNSIWRAACKETGIKIKLYNAFRHSLGCQLLDLGYDTGHVQQQLGHKNASMTKRYAKRSNPVMTQALENRRAKIVKIRKEL